jgi:hypothetical protein
MRGDNCGIIVRLVPRATWQQVQAQLSLLRKPNFGELESKYKGRAWFYASPMAKDVGRETRTPVLVLMLAVSFILLIACANLAGLTLVRIARRTPEIPTRLALGATRWTILRQLWSEIFLLALTMRTHSTISYRRVLPRCGRFRAWKMHYKLSRLYQKQGQTEQAQKELAVFRAGEAQQQKKDRKAMEALQNP